MLKNYLKIAFRNFLKQKSYSLINIAGLAIGLSCFFLILLFILDELSFDKHFENSDSIYRVAVRESIGDQEISTAETSSPLWEALVQEYPEVKNATRIEHTPNMLVRYEDKVFNETQFLWVDSTFFDVFSIKLLYGDKKTALKNHHTVVMSETVASKYFDNLSEAIGKVVLYEDGTPYRVSGIAENPEPNSHFHYGMLCPLSSWEWDYRPYWLNNYLYTYIVLQKNYPPNQLEAKFPAFVSKYVAPDIERGFHMSYDEFLAAGNKVEYFLQPLTDIHLHSNLSNELEPNSDITYVYIFSLVAFFILLIACINYMNLSTARSIGRNKEIGMRKVMGSNRGQLIKQFLFEAILISLSALLISVALVQLLLPYFNDIADKQLEVNYFGRWFILPVLCSITFIVGIVAGSYPAFFLSSFNPIIVLKGVSPTGLTSRSMMRSGLVIFQFVISIILISCTIIVYSQLQFIQNKRLGFSKENVVVIKRGWAVGQNPDGTLQETPANETVIDAFKNDLLQYPQILSAAGTTSLPGKDYFNFVGIPEGGSQDKQLNFNYFLADYDFAKTLKLELIEGRFFSRDMASDTLAVVINETAAKTLGYRKPVVGKRIGFYGHPEFHLNIIGVLRDFHYESLHRKVEPMIIGLQNLDRTYIAVRILPHNIAETIDVIKRTWERYIPYKPFEYFFFDEDYDHLYRAEQRTEKLFVIFSLLAIFIACLGLFGLASYTTELKTKEIGIRKVLGAPVSTIVARLSSEFTKWVILANLIAWPVAYFFVKDWLQDFAYRIDLTVWPFLLSGLIALLIAVATVSYQSIKAAFANPTESLRNE